MARKRQYILVVLGILVVGAILLWQYLGQREDRLNAVEAATGRLLWSTSLPESKQVPSAPDSNGKYVVIGLVTERQRSGQAVSLSIIALDAATGQRLWSFTPDPKRFGTLSGYNWAENGPILIQDAVFANILSEGTATLVALDAASGQLKWTVDSPLVNRRSPSPEVRSVGERLFVLVAGRSDSAKPFSLLALDPETGKALQTLATYDEDAFGSFNGPYLLADDRSVYVVADQGIFAFDAKTGAQRYTIDQPRTRLWVSGKTLYTRKLTSVSAYDAQTGAANWVHRASALPANAYLTSIRADSDGVYVVCNCRGDVDRLEEGWLIALDKGDGHERWARPYTDISSSALFLAPAPAGDLIFVTGGTRERGGIMAFARADGIERWHFVSRTLDGFGDEYSPVLRPPVTDGTRVFVLDFIPRWRHLLTQINPGWR